jgi:hypothetical protein
MCFEYIIIRLKLCCQNMHAEWLIRVVGECLLDELLPEIIWECRRDKVHNAVPRSDCEFGVPRRGVSE